MVTQMRRLALAFAAMLFACGALDGTALAQSNRCDGAPVEPGQDHTGEATVLTAIDQDGRAFTLTRNEETGAWALWAITEFTREEGGLEVGRPCVVLDGRESKVLVVTPEEPVTAAPEAPAASAAAATDPDAETFRVTRVDAGAVLDLRAGPGTDNESIRQIPPDGTGIVVGSCREVDGYQYPWCQATWEGAQGWASACCLEGERTGRRLD